MFVTNRVGSTDKARERLAFEARTPLREGLQSVVAWRTYDRGAAAARPTA
jgi:nucleoside-diphosphate-sugar epimerase